MAILSYMLSEFEELGRCTVEVHSCQIQRYERDVESESERHHLLNNGMTLYITSFILSTTSFRAHFDVIAAIIVEPIITASNFATYEDTRCGESNSNEKPALEPSLYKSSFKRCT